MPYQAKLVERCTSQEPANKMSYFCVLILNFEIDVVIFDILVNAVLAMHMQYPMTTFY